MFLFMFVCVGVFVCGFFFSRHWSTESFVCVHVFHIGKLFNKMGRNWVTLVISSSCQSFRLNLAILAHFKSMKLTANNDGKCQNVDLANRTVNDSP